MTNPQDDLTLQSARESGESAAWNAERLGELQTPAVRQPTGAYARAAAVSDADRMRITTLVDSVTFEIEASRGSVADLFSPEAREDLAALRELLVRAGIERRVAHHAVDRLIQTRRPIFECIAAAAAHDWSAGGDTAEVREALEVLTPRYRALLDRLEQS